MIKYIAGHRASGVGLIRHLLVRGGREVLDFPRVRLDDPPPEAGEFYTGVVEDWLLKAKSRSLVLIRCPMSSLLNVLDIEARKMGRVLIDEEVEFHARVMAAQMTTINSLIGSGVGHFIIRRDGSLRDKLPRLMELICGEDITREGDFEAFMEASSPGKYTPSMIPAKPMREIYRMGGMYGKFNIDLEVGK